jgi:hypothetical protein
MRFEEEWAGGALRKSVPVDAHAASPAYAPTILLSFVPVLLTLLFAGCLEAPLRTVTISVVDRYVYQH